MATLEIGTLPGQIPTNGDLGELAFQSKDSVSFTDGRGGLRHLDIAAINRQLNITAVRVFVYDTGKDSDAGAWRKRCQNTSWYNETLNTSVRGSRREFPSVAVIVVTSTTVTIYDGDDPSLPMWMVFPSTGSVSWGTGGTSTLNAAVALNATVVVSSGLSSGGGIQLYNFAKDDIALAYNTTLYSLVDRKIATGRLAKTNITGVGEYTLHNYQVYDVAITTLPGAPIDAVTGLPAPTIAVATATGVSVIRHDGTTVSGISTNNIANSISFFRNGDYLAVDTSGYPYVLRVSALPFSTGSYMSTFLPANTTYGWSHYSVSEGYGVPVYVQSGAGGSSYKVGQHPDYLVSLSDKGLGIISENFTNPSAGLYALIASKYNTGWLIGNTKGAWLSDTTPGFATSPTNLITNGDFATGISGWSGSALSYDSGNQRGQVTNSALYGGITQSFSTTAGKYYFYKADVTCSANNQDVRIQIAGIGLASGAIGQANTTGTTTIYGWLYSPSGGTYTLQIIPYGANYASTYYVDNVFVYEVESDRSINGRGLQVAGTLTKTSVSSGADLVAYGGFSASNYLTQPVAYTPGTGDFMIACWVKPQTIDTGSGNYFHLFNLHGSGNSGQNSTTGFVLKMSTYSGASAYGYIPYFYNGNASGDKGTYSTSNYLPLQQWSFLVGYRTNGRWYVSINGRTPLGGGLDTANLTDAILHIGTPSSVYSEYGGDALISLLRFSYTAPSQAQILKMYNDEKMLFQDNSKAVLYGSSDTVTALAYDEDTTFLHAGTSSGRSVFNGLRRVDNTTVAVSASISAANGLVAEQ